jgi:hypothetical protein
VQTFWPNAIVPLRPITTFFFTATPNVFHLPPKSFLPEAARLRSSACPRANRQIKNHRLLTDAHDLPLSLLHTTFHPFLPFAPSSELIEKRLISLSIPAQLRESRRTFLRTWPPPDQLPVIGGSFIDQQVDRIQSAAEPVARSNSAAEERAGWPDRRIRAN